ncbi:hypothetical protein Tco_1580820, partial [Tanacetum coccineum]
SSGSSLDFGLEASKGVVAGLTLSISNFLSMEKSKITRK